MTSVNLNNGISIDSIGNIHSISELLSRLEEAYIIALSKEILCVSQKQALGSIISNIFKSVPQTEKIFNCYFFISSKNIARKFEESFASPVISEINFPGNICDTVILSPYRFHIVYFPHLSQFLSSTDSLVFIEQGKKDIQKEANEYYHIIKIPPEYDKNLEALWKLKAFAPCQ